MNIHNTTFIFIKIMTMVMFASWIEWMARFRRLYKLYKLYKLGFFTFDSARASHGSQKSSGTGFWALVSMGLRLHPPCFF